MISPKFKCHLDISDFHIYIFGSLSWNPDSYPTAYSTPLLGCPIDLKLNMYETSNSLPTHKYASSTVFSSQSMEMSSFQLLRLKTLQSSLNSLTHITHLIYKETSWLFLQNIPNHFSPPPPHQPGHGPHCHIIWGAATISQLLSLPVSSLFSIEQTEWSFCQRSCHTLCSKS